MQARESRGGAGYMNHQFGTRKWHVAEDNGSGGLPVGGGAAVVGPRWPWVVLFAVVGAALCAYGWATATPAKPPATFLTDQVQGFGMFLILCALGGALANWRRPFQGLQLPLTILPLYLVGLVPPIASATVGWEGGWTLGFAGAALGVGAGAITGWLFTRWILAEAQRSRVIVSGTMTLPIAFGVLFAVYGAHNWAIVWLQTLDQAWMIALFPIVFALLGALVGKPLLGLLSALPLVPVQLIPLVASLTVGWEGGWILGIAGAAAGATAGAANGWLYNRWIMPEYEKRRARESARVPLAACRQCE
jgi:hypothetical protein